MEENHSERGCAALLQVSFVTACLAIPADTLEVAHVTERKQGLGRHPLHVSVGKADIAAAEVPGGELLSIRTPGPVDHRMGGRTLGTRGAIRTAIRIGKATKISDARAFRAANIGIRNSTDRRDVIDRISICNGNYPARIVECTHAFF